MALTIVATAGSASANSFATFAEMSAYMQARPNADAWWDVSEQDAFAALIAAGRELNVMAWRGYPVTATQAMAWPRTVAPDPDAISEAVYYSITVVPQRVKDAQCELAWQYKRAGTTDIASEDELAAVIRKKIDVIETEYAHPTLRSRGIERYPLVVSRLAPLLRSGVGQVRLVR